MAKKYTRHRRHRRTRRRTRKMRGGAFSQQELQQLQQQGINFTQNQIESLNDLGVSLNEVLQKVDNIRNSGINDPDEINEQVIVELLNEHIFENPNANDMIPHAHDDVHDIDEGDLNLSMDESQGSLHLSDLDVSQGSMGANTTLLDESLNASQMSNISLPSNFSENESFASEMGGKKRRRKSSRKNKKSAKKGKKSRKQRGGMCFGNGVGANSYDPNFSIYNTRELELFPYRPK